MVEICNQMVRSPVAELSAVKREVSEPVHAPDLKLRQFRRDVFCSHARTVISFVVYISTGGGQKQENVF